MDFKYDVHISMDQSGLYWHVHMIP